MEKSVIDRTEKGEPLLPLPSSTQPTRRPHRRVVLPILLIAASLVSLFYQATPLSTILSQSPSNSHKAGHSYPGLGTPWFWREALGESNSGSDEARHHYEEWKERKAVKGYLRSFRSRYGDRSKEKVPSPVQEDRSPEEAEHLMFESGSAMELKGTWPELPIPKMPHHMTPKEAEELFLTIPDADSARTASHSFTSIVHIAGSAADRLSALRVKAQWEALLNLPASEPDDNVFESGSKESQEALMGKSKYKKSKCGKKKGGWKKSLKKIWKKFGRSRGKKEKGIDFPWLEKPRVWVDTYYPLLNYPISHSLALYNSSTTSSTPRKPVFTASLREDSLPLDPTSSVYQPTFHGFSFNGTATGPLVYAGRGTWEDFQRLKKEGIDFKGTVAIVQYGGSFRGLKVQAAAEVGCLGILIYTDPIEDGEITVENGYKSYPDGPARQPSSVQRGSAQYLSIYPGDPLTPFTPAYKNTTSRLPRDSPDINIPPIPSLPISYKDALPLLKSLNGKGIKADSLDWGRGGTWKEGGLEYEGVEYWTGPGEEVVEMANIMDDRVTQIWNTMAVIPGHLKDEVVVLGNHNDAWTFGAGDPNSGTASVHEIVKGFGVLLEKGWRPLRTIVLASWDAEEYGLIGSTEFGEDFSTWLKENVVAYLNVDISVVGTSYAVGASPSLADLFKDVSAVIQDPDQPERSLLDKMRAEGAAEGGQALKKSEVKVGALGSGSDFTVFLQYLGLASANLAFQRKSTDPVYHYHSIYDSAYWMDHFGDPTFGRHVAISKVLGLATLRLTDSILLPINITSYALELSTYVSKVRDLTLTSPFLYTDSLKLPLEKLSESVHKLQVAAEKLEMEIAEVEEALPSAYGVEFFKLMKKARAINKRLQKFEGGFIDEGGLPGREWYRNLVVSPGRYLGYGATTLPALTESLTLDHNTTQAAVEIDRLILAFNGNTRMLAMV